MGQWISIEKGCLNEIRQYLQTHSQTRPHISHFNWDLHINSAAGSFPSFDCIRDGRHGTKKDMILPGA